MSKYWPIFRGKQFELLALKELAEKLAASSINPVIEPVKLKTEGLQRTLKALRNAEVPTTIIVNPEVGEFANSSGDLLQNLEPILEEAETVRAISSGLITFALSLDSSIGGREITDIVSALKDSIWLKQKPVVHLVLRGFADPYLVKKILDDAGLEGGAEMMILVEDPPARKYYQDVFGRATFIQITDGFEKRKNADYAKRPTEFFHTAAFDYPEQGFGGFGDYSIVGREFSETGGPAWAVAIHLTFTASSPVYAMYVRHYVSDDNDSPSFPAEKYLQALDKLVADVSAPNSSIQKTSAVREFVRLHENGHFPGLGYVKKLSMIHHMEVMVKILDV